MAVRADPSDPCRCDLDVLLVRIRFLSVRVCLFVGATVSAPGENPPVCAIVARDEHRIHFRLADPPKANRDKYADELLDADLFIEDADALYAEYVARGVEFTRALGDTAWHSREFVVKDCDGRLLAFGSDRG